MRRLISTRRDLGILVAALATLAALVSPGPAAAQVPASFFGVSAVAPSESDYQRMAETGFGAYRFPISWRNVQRTREGAFDWSEPDASVIEAARAGMQPTPFVFGTPRFVSNSGRFFPPTGSAADRREWQEFLAAATRRYGPNGEFWQQYPSVPVVPATEWIIWNEQNALAFWAPKPDPREYATLVRISDQAISGVDPGARIVLGGMFGYPKGSNKSLDAVDFLRDLYEVRGIERHFDAINLHPYGAGVDTVRQQIKQARTTVRKAGDPNVGILVGELGWASKGPSRSEEVVGAKGQADRLRISLELLIKKRRAWNIDGAYVYVWRDFKRVEGGCLWCPGAGLLERGGKGKPALNTVRSVISRAR